MIRVVWNMPDPILTQRPWRLAKKYDLKDDDPYNSLSMNRTSRSLRRLPPGSLVTTMTAAGCRRDDDVNDPRECE
jgi:hypothetical protein